MALTREELKKLSEVSAPFGMLQKDVQLRMFEAWLEQKQVLQRIGHQYSPVDTPTWTLNCVYRVALPPEEFPSIDWNLIEKKFMYLYVTKCNRVFLSEYCPRLATVYVNNPNDCMSYEEWKLPGGLVSEITGLFTSFKRGTMSWKESLVMRA